MSPTANFIGEISLDSVGVNQSKAQHYYAASLALRPGLSDLEAACHSGVHAFILVAGFAVEGLLKTLLARAAELSPTSKPIPRTHSLKNLWNAAVEGGHLSTEACPDWLIELDGLHDSPFFVRYQTGGGFHSLPSKVEVAQGLDELYRAVERALQRA